ncbi:hypothetical protein K503DRAFT_800374 [Rhizopogon vinicolor AM-OR11-026]|uniref:DUF6535 domain-containing protein n=1 Tax=Rhizopogon vinicolor AM-OR11-026 TaxID=1314800 RepID=A0A1B7N0Y0_9AGAM|nr:hypothetical protein K503DRAFT_800374 [Rhizopogon vinicolor AM-OR11-026]
MAIPGSAACFLTLSLLLQPYAIVRFASATSDSPSPRLHTSTISEERGQDPLSKILAIYRKVSRNYDDHLLEMYSGKMDIVPTFAGLFAAAVNTAFIIAIYPNPVNTTNTLLVQLIQITSYGPSTAQPSTLSASTGYSSAEFWTQGLAYASLTFNLFAAFGAVLGEQWLGYYKTNHYGRGSLESRYKQGHCKYQMLQD